MQVQKISNKYNYNAQFMGSLVLIDNRKIKSGVEIVSRKLSSAEDKFVNNEHVKVCGSNHKMGFSSGLFGVTNSTFVEYIEQISKVLGIDKSLIKYNKLEPIQNVRYDIFTESNGRRYYKIQLNSRYSIAHELNLNNIN